MSIIGIIIIILIFLIIIIIEQLARMKSNNFGMSLCTVDGQRYSLGEAQVSLKEKSNNETTSYI